MPVTQLKPKTFFLLGLFILIGVQPLIAQPIEKEQTLTQMVVGSIANWHIDPGKLDDSFSQKAFTLFIKQLDPSKRFLMAEDIQALEAFRYKIDNEVQENTNELFESATQKLNHRIRYVNSFYKAILKEPIDFQIKDSLNIDPDKRDYATSKTALKEHWRKLIKYQVLLNAIYLYEEQLKKDKVDPIPNTITITKKMQKKAVKKTLSSLKRTFSRLLKKPRKDLFASYLDAIAQSHDPHTTYFPPEDKEDFDIGMTGRLEGIGAVLREDDGFIKVVRIIPGSAAWKQQELKPEDIILKVAQGSKEPVDIVDVPVREAVKYIRGKKGSLVRLTVKKPDNRVTVIPIVRDVVVIEDTYAKAATIKHKSFNKTFGYIYLPSFYRDFRNRRARNAASDIKKHLIDLKKRKISGIILDLRNNGGGSLKDAVLVSGHFIKNGPIVQVKNQNDKNEVLYDYNPEIVYDGPLVVLVNNFSASASEILAAALQDYARAIIIGSRHSFGKGTVQTFVDLDKHLPPDLSHLKPMGSLKMTIQKFFRITGGSTQYKGVVPNIVVPSTSDYLDVGERTLPNSLKWSYVNKLSYRPWTQKTPQETLIKASAFRISQKKHFKKIEEYVSLLKKERKAPQTLNLQSAWKKQQSIKKETDALKILIDNTKLLTIESLHPPKTSLKNEESSPEDWIKNINNDVMIDEAMAVLADFH